MMEEDNATHHDIPLMAGNVRLTLYGVDGDLAREIALAVRDEGKRLQRIFNLYDQGSELSRLNRERRIRASPELLQVVRVALGYCALTKGRYDISLGKQFLQRKRGEAITPVGCSYNDIIVEGESIRLAHPDAVIDLGSIAKGFIADRMLECALDRGVESAFIDARGDMRIAGPRLEVIDVQHPREDRTLRPFVLEGMAVATSGDYRQHTGSYETSHIINAQGIASATVVAPSTMEADAIATAVFVSGVDGAKRLLADIPHAKALLITPDGEEVTLNGFETIELEAQLRPPVSTAEGCEAKNDRDDNRGRRRTTADRATAKLITVHET